MDIFEKILGGVVALIATIYLLINGLAPAMPANFTLTLGGTDYTWAIGLVVLVFILSAVFVFYKGMKGGKK